MSWSPEIPSLNEIEGELRQRRILPRCGTPTARPSSRAAHSLSQSSPRFTFGS